MNQRSLKYAFALASALTLAGSALAQTAPATQPGQPAAKPEADESIVMTPFEVSDSKNVGYQAQDTLAGSRINTNLTDVGSAISVITAEFLKDVGATDNKSLLQYTANTEVGGPQGNFRGASGGPSEDESGKFTNPNGNTRVRGLTSADNTRNFFVSDAPWDGYNIERVEIQRGPNSILFGLGSPAGIINTTTKSADHRNFGSTEFRFGSYGSYRFTLDTNMQLLNKELSARVMLLHNKEFFRQEPAYSRDRRVFATVRYDPKFLNKGEHKTTLKVNFETGKIDSNNPRSITPRDQITKWWDTMGKKGYDPTLVQNSGWFYDAQGVPFRNANSGQYSRTWAGAVPNNPATGKAWTEAEAGRPLPGNGAANANYSPWLGAPAFYGGVWLQVMPMGSSPYQASMPEYKNVRGVNTSGAIDGSLGTPGGARRVTVANTAYWSERATEAEGAKYQQFGVWKAATLTDPSLFDFYNKLIDGSNKEEWQNFDIFNASLSQTFFNNKFGFEAAYDHQSMDRGQYSFDGAGILFVDINTHNIDGSVNRHYGQPYLETNYLYGNSASESTRSSGRLTAFFDHNFNKGSSGGFLRKLLGRHTLTGLLSAEDSQSDSRGFARYGTEDSFAPLIANKGNAWFIDSNDRVVAQSIYLGDSLASRSTYRDANISNAGPEIQVPSTMAWRWFDSTWNAPSTVSPAAAWTNTYDGSSSTQSENPANYVGWTSRNIKILSAENGDQDALTRNGTLNKRVVESIAGSWQAYLWDGAVVGLYGLRQDTVKTKALEASRDVTYNRAYLGDTAIQDPGSTTARTLAAYSLKDAPETNYIGHTKSWSVVAKLNKLMPDRWLPLNISLYYNKSDNFQVTGTRNDLYGNPLQPPSGETKDMGIMLSTKNQKYFLKINKYESTVLNASNSTIDNNLWYLMGGDNFITRLESRADAYQYHMKVRDDFKSINFLDSSNPTDRGSWGWSYTPLTGETEEHATLTRMAAVAAWRAFSALPTAKKIIDAWGYPALNANPLTQTTQTNPTKLVANFRTTEDQRSEGYEIEFTANPTKNWRISINASESIAQRSNVGGAAITEFTQYANEYHNKRFVRVSGPGDGVIAVADGLYSDGKEGTKYYFREATAAEILADAPNINSVGSGTVNNTFGGMGGFATWGGGGARNGTMVSWNSNYYSKYLLLKLQEGANTPELRRWRYNVVSNYDFKSGKLKGVNVGVGYRWQDKVAIGYPVVVNKVDGLDKATFDIENPYYGPALDALDLWFGYSRKLTSKVNWKMQLNIRNVGDGNKLMPLSAQPDGSVAAWGIAPSQSWTLTNTFSF